MSETDDGAALLLCRPVGFYHSDRQYKAQSPRQGVLAGGSGRLELLGGNNYEQALDDLDGFDRIWLIFDFHHNRHWKPKVSPPVSGHKKKVGLFASRSPYRPNPLGLSCVRLEKIERLKLFVRECDLLDGTPVLDIKPYLPWSDAFADAAAGWTSGQKAVAFQIDCSDDVHRQCAFIFSEGGPDLKAAIEAQLAFQPDDNRHKRITQLTDGKWCLAFRTWRIDYTMDRSARLIKVTRVYSGYTSIELNDPADPYNDKDLHRNFKATVG